MACVLCILMVKWPAILSTLCIDGHVAWLACTLCIDGHVACLLVLMGMWPVYSVDRWAHGLSTLCIDGYVARLLCVLMRGLSTLCIDGQVVDLSYVLLGVWPVYSRHAACTRWCISVDSWPACTSIDGHVALSN